MCPGICVERGTSEGAGGTSEGAGGTSEGAGGTSEGAGVHAERARHVQWAWGA